MKPLVLHQGAAAAIFWTCAGAWAVAETAWRFWTNRGEGSVDLDWSVGALWLATYGALAAGFVTARQVESLALPGPGWWPLALGLGVFGAGLALRAWAIRALGRFFKYSVVVQPGQEVVDTGPYSRIRHPSYTGLVMAMLGLGIALGNWLAIAACLVPPLAGFTLRLLYEEEVLSRELGEPYRAYMARTHRLLPGIW